MIEIPQSFRVMPRWWHGGAEWLNELPALVNRQCSHWRLVVDGPPMHGSNALVLPVRRGTERLALRLTPPTDDVTAEVRALRFWDGRGTVQLINADIEAGATLLERLEGSRSANDLPLEQAVPILARMMRRLAVRPPPDAHSTTSIATVRLGSFETDWEHLRRPFDRYILEAALDCAAQLATSTSDLAVNGDLHFEQVLAASREPWLSVDPVLLRGDIEYDLARILWSRLDEMPDTASVLRHLHTIAEQADLDTEQARSWVIFRTIDYWLWALNEGLTEDPVRCARLAAIFL